MPDKSALKLTRGAVVAAAAIQACYSPGGAVHGHISAESGRPIAGAIVIVAFRDGTAVEVTPDPSGQFLAAWSHGSWKGAIVRASAPGKQATESPIGWDSWACDFTLADEKAPPQSSKAVCTRGITPKAE